MITVAVPIPETVRPGDTLRAVGNFGATLSAEKTVSRRRVEAYPQSRASAGRWLQGPWLAGPWLDEPPGGGFLEGPWLQGPWLAPRPVRIVELSDLYGYGPFTMALVPEDALGQDKGDPPPTQTIFVAEPPLPLDGHSFNAYDAGSGTVTFDVSVATLIGGA